MSKATPSYTVIYFVEDDAHPDRERGERFAIKAGDDAQAITEAQSAIAWRNAIRFEVLRETSKEKSLIDNSSKAACDSALGRPLS